MTQARQALKGKWGMAIGAFSGYDKISDWALQSMTWAVNTGLISGVDKWILDPKAEMTRAELATVLMSYFKIIAK